MLEKVWRKVFPSFTVVQSLWRRVCGSLIKKLKVELPYDPTIPFLGTYPENTTRHGNSLNVC